MAIFNRSTLLARIAALINRTTPFDANPLVQKTEDLTVRQDVVDSMLTREADSFSINTPGASFTVDFAGGQVCNINTVASIPAAFNITIANLRPNEFGKIVVNKKSNDVFDFSNGRLTSLDQDSQRGTSTLSFFVFSDGNTIAILPNYAYQKTTDEIKDAAVTTPKIANGAVTPAKIAPTSWVDLTLINGWGGTLQYKVDVVGNIHVRGDLDKSSVTASAAAFTIANIPSSITPNEDIRFAAPFRNAFNTLVTLHIDVSSNTLEISSTGVNVLEIAYRPFYIIYRAD